MITDFGTSQKANTQFLTTVKKAMTPFYASLEQLNEEDAHSAFDIWALGILLYTLMAKKEPFTQIGVLKRSEAIRNNSRQKLSLTYSRSLRDLVDFCLTLNPMNRPSIEKVLRYPIVRTELNNILRDFLPLTYKYPTATSAHLMLEQVLEIQCMLAK